MSYSSTKNFIQSVEEAYTKGDYDLVIKELLENKSNLDMGIFHYNLGTAYLKKGSLAVSRFHLEKAYNAGYLNPGLVKNLSVVKGRLSVQEVETSDHIFDNVLAASKSIPTSAFYSFSLALLFIVIVLYRFKRITHIAGSVVVGLSLTVALLGSWTKSSYQTAFMLQDSKVFEGPSESFDVSQEVPAGVRVFIKKQDSKWLYISSPVHLVGWIQRSKLGIL